MKNKSLKNHHRNNLIYKSQNRLLYAKLLSILAVTITILSFIGDTKLFSTHSSISLNWWAILMLVLDLIVLGLLDLAHDGVFWINLSKRKKQLPDERQLQVRQRVFEKSYKYISVALWIIIFILPELSINRSNFPMIQCALFIYSIPNIIASWQKNA